MAPKIVALVGATATGKSSLALQIAEGLGTPVELISVDSMQVYRGMDIGTAKASPAEQALVPHWLIDVADPDDPMDARRFADLSAAAIADIHFRGGVPILVGGTGLWLRALLHGLMPAPPADRALRLALEQLGPAALHARLSEADPVAATRIHPNDAVRCIRALEVLELTGRTISEHQAEHAAQPPRHQALQLGVRWPRATLYAHIDARTQAMFDAGFVDEVRSLLAAGHARTLRPMGALGYKHVCAALAGEIPMEDAVRLTQRDTRRYAKRQATWFGNDPGIHWLEAPPDAVVAADLIRQFLTEPEGRPA